MTLCAGCDIRRKATKQCQNCEKPLCDSCFDIHIHIFQDCGESYNVAKRIPENET